MPALVALSHVDQADQDAVHRQLKAMPAKDKTFLTYDAGMLTDCCTRSAHD
jgi:hypothetical protein